MGVVPMFYITAKTNQFVHVLKWNNIQIRDGHTNYATVIGIPPHLCARMHI